MTQVLDAAYPAWTPDSLKAAGIPAICRYLSWLPNSKVITPQEYGGYLAAGIAVTLNWESTGKSWRAGYEQGHSEGAEARRQARALGHPDDRPVIQSIDENVDPALLPLAVAYQQGFNDGGGCGPQGAYSTALVLNELAGRGLISVGWQTNARGWYGNQDDSPHASLIQRTSKSHPSFPSNSYDESDIVGGDWGQHPATPETPSVEPPPAVHTPPPKPVAGGTEIDMSNAKTKTIDLSFSGFGLFVGEWNVGHTVAACQATVNGPAPAPFGPDEWWEWTIDATVAAQIRGSNVVVTGFFPKWKKGDPAPQVNLLAISA